MILIIAEQCGEIVSVGDVNFEDRVAPALGCKHVHKALWGHRQGLGGVSITISDGWYLRCTSQSTRGALARLSTAGCGYFHEVHGDIFSSLTDSGVVRCITSLIFDFSRRLSIMAKPVFM